MLFGQNRDELRRFYIDSWRKRQQGVQLDGLEAQVADVVANHPEYHSLLGSSSAVAAEWTPEMGESNPFLHMGMHIAIQEQLSTDRPSGIRAAYQSLLMRLGDAHAVEHQMMECLGEAMWSAQRSGTAPDEPAYLECVKRS